MVEGAKEEGGEEKRDGVQRELCYAGEGGPVGWRLIASDRKLVPAQDVGPIVANHDQKGDEGEMRGDCRDRGWLRGRTGRSHGRHVQ